MECCGRPNRSDSHVSKEEEAKIEGETREYFDGLAPQRHSKPQRSDYSSTYVDGVPSSKDVIPEQLVFQQLEHGDSQKLVYNGSEVRDEFVETEYYKDLNCIDKQHHTTGTGFIAVDNAEGKSFNLAPDNTTGCHASSHGNPATNDWIPAANDMVDSASDKPKRSDN
ncbi:hypothetical protein ACR8G9_22365 [Salmonella enterica subsp. enterica serovar Paratyphi A]